MRMVNPYDKDEIGFRRTFMTATFALGTASTAFFAVYPNIDLEVSRHLRVCPGAVHLAPWCATDPVVETLRNIFIAASIFIAAAVLVGLVRTLRERGQIFGLAQARWWFLAASLAVGPGLIANVVFKDNWGRARPRTVVEFGGAKQYTPPLVPAHECGRNCSFVSGEASSAYVPFFAAAMVLPQARLALLVGGIAAGLGAGLVRVSQGGHFLSDILFAGIFMAMTASALHVLFIGLWQKRGLDHYLSALARTIIEAVVGVASLGFTPRR